MHTDLRTSGFVTSLQANPAACEQAGRHEVLQWQGDAAANSAAVWTRLRTEFFSCLALLVFGTVLPSKVTIDLIHSVDMARGGAMVGFLGDQQGICRPSRVGLKPELSFRWASLNNALTEARDLITAADAGGAGEGLLAQEACTTGRRGRLSCRACSCSTPQRSSFC